MSVVSCPLSVVRTDTRAIDNGPLTTDDCRFMPAARLHLPGSLQPEPGPPQPERRGVSLPFLSPRGPGCVKNDTPGPRRTPIPALGALSFPAYSNLRPLAGR